MERDKYELLLERLAYKYNKPVKVIKNIVESQFEFIAKEQIPKLDFNSIETEEEFNKTKKNFNIKYLFILNPNWKSLQRIKKRKNGEEESSTKS